MPPASKSQLKLSPARRRWLNQQVRNGRFSDPAEALNFCVAQAARMEKAREEFDRSIAKADRGPYERADAAWWTNLRREAEARRKSRARRKSAGIG